MIKLKLMRVITATIGRRSAVTMDNPPTKKKGRI